MHLKHDGTSAETRFRLSAKRTSPFKSAGAVVQSTTGSRGVRISLSNAAYATFRGSVRVLATIRQFPFHFPSRASPCTIRFQTHSTDVWSNIGATATFYLENRVFLLNALPNQHTAWRHNPGHYTQRHIQ